MWLWLLGGWGSRVGLVWINDRQLWLAGECNCWGKYANMMLCGVPGGGGGHPEVLIIQMYWSSRGSHPPEVINFQRYLPGIVISQKFQPILQRFWSFRCSGCSYTLTDLLNRWNDAPIYIIRAIYLGGMALQQYLHYLPLKDKLQAFTFTRNDHLYYFNCLI